MNDKIYDLSIFLPVNSDSENFKIYRKVHMGIFYDIFRTREKFYIFFLFVFYLFYSLGILLYDYLPIFSISDKLSSLFNISVNISFYIEVFFLSFLIYLFGFTVYSKLVNFMIIGVLSFNFGHLYFTYISFYLFLAISLIFFTIILFSSVYMDVRYLSVIIKVYFFEHLFKLGIAHNGISAVFILFVDTALHFNYDGVALVNLIVTRQSEKSVHPVCNARNTAV